MHELGTLVDAISAGGSFDCLKMPSLLSVEIVARRIYQVTDAHATPGRVNWSNSKYLKGTVGVEDIVPQEMRSFVHRESRAEVELATARARQQNLASGAVVGDAVADEGDAGGSPLDGAPPVAGGGRGRGKGGGKSGGRFPRGSPSAPAA